MPFASAALQRRHNNNGRIDVSEVFQLRLQLLPWITLKAGWRFWVLNRVGATLGKFWLIFATYGIPIVIWLAIRGCAKVLKLMGIGDGTFLSSSVIRETIMRVALWFFMRSKAGADIFWYNYFIHAQSLDAFLVDYCEAWSIQATSDRELTMFVDNDHRLVIPCSSGADDKQLLKQLRCFYELALARGGITMFLGLRASKNIEIVKIENDAVGDRVGLPLDLGRYGPYNRQIHYFRNPSAITGDTLLRRLITEHVIIDPNQQQANINQQQANVNPQQATQNPQASQNPQANQNQQPANSNIPVTPNQLPVNINQQQANANPQATTTTQVNPQQPPVSLNPQVNANQPSANTNQQQANVNLQSNATQPPSNPAQQQATSVPPQRRALNVIRTWNPQSATVIVLFPFVLGTIISIVWPIVATRRYDADVQDSVQTGFAVGSYVVTAGALLVALVAFLDTKSNVKD
ncbi:hypothetical protein BDV96DRAFT_694039 [Lophiotrema nucula]|uniref:Uncharacterized protein n=1 Tax=Lophiotrema nucula TaxID=690887 RepID=A0A6A5YJL9_9PLEO|nr:hypothetical protein BDV96DRAFT_694039 [Lophiotrema nucula]